MNKTLKIKTIALAATAALVLPSAALAASSQEGYGGPNNVVAGIEETNGNPPSGGTTPSTDTSPSVGAVADTTAASPVAAESTDSLPFTGADLGVLAVVGALMLAFGFGLRRLTRHPSQP